MSAAEQLTAALTALLAEAGQAASPPPTESARLSWAERLWTAPPETRLGPADLCEALGRTKGWLYRLTRTKKIPHRLLDGKLVFRVGDIRTWLTQHEEVVVTAGLTVTRQSRKGATA